MSKKIFTKKQIEELLKNENIATCSDRSITYSKNFKIKEIRLYEQGLTSREIFKQAGFDLKVLGKGNPKDCLRRWKRIVKKKGRGGLSEARGKEGVRPKKIPVPFGVKGKSDKGKIKRLEAEIAYLKAENDFLAKLRAPVPFRVKRAE